MASQRLRMPGSEPQGGGPLGLDAATMLAAGGFVLVFGVIVVGMTITLTPILAYICVPGGILPGAIALLFGVVEYRREQRLKEFATWIRAYRRIRMDDLAKKVGKPPVEAERLLARAIDLGYVQGVIDRSTDEFVLEGTERQQVFVETCPNCGGNVDRWAFPEERFPCPYCDQAVEISAVHRLTPATPK